MKLRMTHNSPCSYFPEFPYHIWHEVSQWDKKSRFDEVPPCLFPLFTPTHFSKNEILLEYKLIKFFVFAFCTVCPEDKMKRGFKKKTIWVKHVLSIIWLISIQLSQMMFERGDSLENANKNKYHGRIVNITESAIFAR